MKTVRFLLFTGIIAGLLTLANAQVLYPTRPQPEFESNSFCPAEGAESPRADPDLNEKRNRIDHAKKYWSVSLTDIQNLVYPPGIGKKKRSEWSVDQRREVAQWEGLALQMEGYLALTSVKNQKFGATPSAGNSWNCGRTDDGYVDYVLWVTSEVQGKKSRAIVAVMTPRFRKQNRHWTIENLTRIAKQRYKVRIFGWLLLDQEHPEQLGKSRATLWEIHPIVQLDYQERREWKHLEFSAPSLSD